MYVELNLDKKLLSNQLILFMKSFNVKRHLKGFLFENEICYDFLVNLYKNIIFQYKIEIPYKIPFEYKTYSNIIEIYGNYLELELKRKEYLKLYNLNDNNTRILFNLLNLKFNLEIFIIPENGLFLIIKLKNEIEDLMAYFDSFLIILNNKIIIQSNNKTTCFSAKRKVLNLYLRIQKVRSLSLNKSIESFVHIAYKENKNYILIFDILDINKVNLMNGMSDLILSNDLAEFIAGKKNGKINKIMRSTRTEIQIFSNKEISTVRISGCHLKKALEMIFEEHPSYKVFFVDSKHHKRIIGGSGRTIQKIMKKYDVYVKFMSDEEYSSVGYSGNVILITPRKNSENLSKIKNEILEFCGVYKKNYFVEKSILLAPLLKFEFRTKNSIFCDIEEVIEFDNSIYKSEYPEISEMLKCIIY